MMSQLLSIVIPAYNAELFLAEAIESALQQTYPDFEIIVVNDGSTDATKDVMELYRSNPRIKLFDNVVNRGANYTYNYGVLQSNGHFLTFLDADDVLLPGYAENVIRAMQETDYDIGFSNLFVLDKTTKLNTTLYGSPRDPRFVNMFGGPDRTFPNGDMQALRKLILNGVAISPRSIYKRQLFIDYGLEDYRLRIAHDWLRHIRFVLHGASCVFLPSPQGYYRIHENGNSQKDPVGTSIENMKLYEIVYYELAHLMTADERDLAKSIYIQLRTQLLQALATSELRNAEIVQFLAERGLWS